MADDDQILAQWAARIARMSSMASAKSDGSCELRQRAYPGRPATVVPSRLMFPFGLRSVPPAGVDVAELRGWGGVRGSMAVAHDSPRYGPSDLETDGSEVALYNTENARAVVAKGPDVVVNEGDKNVATDTTPVAVGSFAITSTPAGGGLYTMALVWVDTDGVQHTVGQWVSPAAGLAGLQTVTGKIDGGSPNFKAPGP